MSSRCGYVVLHYQALKETIDCVESVLNNTEDSKVVIVDNGSTNMSGKKLLSKYNNNSRVHVILSTTNHGFARGNNIGIAYLRENFDLDFVITLNNDTVIEQSDFESIIAEEYNKSNFAILGPKIITSDGNITSNPVTSLITSKKQIDLLIAKRVVKYLLSKLYLSALIHESGTHVYDNDSYDHNNRYENVKLHGACLIFSKKYFEFFTGFYEKTFLYFEEDILYWRLKQHNLVSVYNPSLAILHLEDVSTKKSTASRREKDMFIFSNEIKSLRVLRDVITHIE